MARPRASSRSPPRSRGVLAEGKERLAALGPRKRDGWTLSLEIAQRSYAQHMSALMYRAAVCLFAQGRGTDDYLEGIPGDLSAVDFATVLAESEGWIETFGLPKGTTESRLVVSRLVGLADQSPRSAAGRLISTARELTPHDSSVRWWTVFMHQPSDDQLAMERWRYLLSHPLADFERGCALEAVGRIQIRQHRFRDALASFDEAWMATGGSACIAQNGLAAAILDGDTSAVRIGVARLMGWWGRRPEVQALIASHADPWNQVVESATLSSSIGTLLPVEVVAALETKA